VYVDVHAAPGLRPVPPAAVTEEEGASATRKRRTVSSSGSARPCVVIVGEGRCERRPAAGGED
jgi:hypothetical protein